MAFQLPDPTTPEGESIARRLRDEPLLWLTTVDASGIPRPTPVWFLWDDIQASLLVYSRANARRLKYIARNPHVSAHLESAGGRDLIIITGEAAISESEPSADQVPALMEKYRELITRFQITPELYADSCPVAIRIRPLALRHARNAT